MQLEARKYLHDVDQATARLTRFVAGRMIDDYLVLIHGYAEIDDQLVWDLLQSHLPALIADVELLKG